MIKLKADLLFISILTALITIGWLILGLAWKTSNNQINLETISPLLKIPTYRIRKGFWSKLSQLEPLNDDLIYDANIQPLSLTPNNKIATKSNAPSPVASTSANKTASNSGQQATKNKI